jgi:hypothetical protein
MTNKQLEQRILQLEREVAELKKAQPKAETVPPKQGWKAWVGAFSGDPFMKEAFEIAKEYRERDRQKAYRKNKPKKVRK